MNIQMLTASTTMAQLQKKLDISANNIANVNTNGFKRSEAVFQDLLTQTIKQQPNGAAEVGRVTPHGLRIGSGARLSQTTFRMEQGTAIQTGVPTDVMLKGDNIFFRTMNKWTDGNGDIQTENLYTRSGNFSFTPVPDEQGLVRLTTPEGNPVLNADGDEIVIPGHYDKVDIDKTGNIRAYYPGSNEPIVETIGVALIERPDMLQGVGDNQFRLGTNADEMMANGQLRFFDLLTEGNPNFGMESGMLEGSNVDLATEMTEIMSTQRLMQFQSKAIQMADDMMGLATSIRG